MALDEVYLGPTIETDVTRVYLGTDIVFQRGAGGLDADVQALLDQAVIDGYTPCSGIALSALNTFVTSLKSDGIWTLLDVIWLPATNGDSDFACYNILDPTQFNLTKVNSPAYTQLEGFTGDGVSAYIETNFNPSSDGVNFLGSSASMFIYTRTLANCIFGGSTTSSINEQTAIIIGGSNIRTRLNISSTGQQITTGSNNGLIHTNAPDSTTHNLYINGSLIQSKSKTNVIANQTIPILAFKNQAGSVIAPSNGQFAFAGVGSDLSTKSVEMYSAIQTYMTTLGTQV